MVNAREQHKNAYRSNVYVHGNTAPKRQPREGIYELPRRQAKGRPAGKNVQRNRDKALYMNIGYVLFLAAATMIMVAVSGVYLHLQAELTGRIRHVSSLKGELLNLKMDNDAEQKRIDKSVNLEEIRNRATGELGMIYPSKDQIIYFEVDSTDYMNQYQDIPAE